MRPFFCQPTHKEIRRRFLCLILAAAALLLPLAEGMAADEAGSTSAQVVRLKPQPWQNPRPAPLGEGPTRLSVYVIGFGGKPESAADRISRDLAGKSTSWDAFAIIDAAGGDVVVFDGGASAVNPTDRRSAIYRTLRDQFLKQASATDVNLPVSLQVVSDILRSYGNRLKSSDIYLLDGLLHKSGDVDFTKGYPNDGFLLLDDNPFAFVAAAPTPASKFHIFLTAPIEYPQNYQRFATLLANQLFSAQLVSFSPNMIEGELPQIAATPLDSSVTRSVVVRPDVKPVCAYDDEIITDRTPNYRMMVSVRNPCRSNSVVSFIVNGEPINLNGDQTGTAVLNSRLTVGQNTIDVLGINGVAHNVLSETVSGLDDKVTVTLTADGVVLQGYNPLRPDDSEVEIVHAGSGRTWRIRVRDDRWRLEAPLAVGHHFFKISRLNSDAPQQVEVTRLDGGGNETLNRIYSMGGQSGYIQAGLIWNDKNDLDLVVQCPTGEHVGNDKNAGCGGNRDVDRNFHPPYQSDPAENIVWKEKPASGTYKVGMVFYESHETQKSQFEVFVIIDGKEVFRKKNALASENEKRKFIPLFTFDIK